MNFVGFNQNLKAQEIEEVDLASSSAYQNLEKSLIESNEFIEGSIPVIDLNLNKNPVISQSYDNEISVKSSEFTNDPFSVGYLINTQGDITVDTLIMNEGLQAMCADNVFGIQNEALGVPFARMYRTVDMASAKTSLLRNGKTLGNDSDLNVKSSLETFYGYGNNKVEDVINQSPKQNIHTGAALNLMSSFDQCVRKTALFRFMVNYNYYLDQKIRNVDWTLGEVIEMFYQKYPEMQEADYLKNLNVKNHPCNEILPYRGFEEEMLNLQKGIAFFPLYLDRMYRYAFLIEAISMSDPTPFRPSGDWVRAMAFKVPDVAANRPDGDISQIYNDPIHYLAHSLVRPSELNDYKYQIEKEKEQILDAQIQKKLISCVGVSCDDPLTKALLELIEKTNARNTFNTRYLWHEKDHGSMECRQEPYPYEEVKEIQDLAALGKVNPPLFTAPSNQIEKPGEGIWHFGNLTTIGQIRRWIVHPYGWDMEYIEDILKGSVFNPKEKEQYYRDWECHIRLPIKEISVKHEVKYYPTIITSNIAQDQNSEFELKEASKTKDEGDQGTITTLGGRLGFLTHFMQKFFQKENSKQYQYLSTCETTEDYLLDNCQNPPEKCPTPLPSPTAMPEVCVTKSTSGGYGVEVVEKKWDSFGDGKVCIGWDMYTMPDKMEVFLDGTSIFKTNGPCQQSGYPALPDPGKGCEDFVSHKGKVEFDYKAGQKIKIVMTGASHRSTRWILILSCPNAGCRIP